jgi:hypothetical protein
LPPDRTPRRRRPAAETISLPAAEAISLPAAEAISLPAAEAISLPAGKDQVSPNQHWPEGTLPEDLR